MGLFDRRRLDGLDDAVRSVVPLGPGERVLAWGRDGDSGAHVVATTHHLAHVDGSGQLVWSRPWHLAEAGTWESESARLTVTWVDRSEPSRWTLRDPSLLQQTLRERLQASVVLADEFRTERRRTVRVVIRQDLASGGLVEQVVPGKGADLTDPRVAAEAAAMLARLRSEVGL